MKNAMQISDKSLPEEIALIPVESSVEKAVLEFSFCLNLNEIVDYVNSHQEDFDEYLADMAAKGLSFD